MREAKKDGYKAAGHDFPFKPAKDTNVKVKSAFTHLTDLNVNKKVYRNAEGEVITAPINFLTNPMKKGANGRQVYLGGNIPYKGDPYNNRKLIEKKEREEHDKLLQDKPFSQRVKSTGTFVTQKEAYGEDRNYPQRKLPGKRKPLMEHDFPFKPSNPPKLGYNKTLDKFPEYKPDPMRFV